ncbi:MAG TPA: bifunctional homocysteine S-methyltransferase/methylenetetrahydrofolate reductase [Ktedonobacterales bacterium]|nr:bifunctional homocysteine S-methyltransferase/methylenetetrahydrofolate reductase [Ktedonobacterales bacterium]
MSEPFLDRLRQGPLLCDGAMGTMLYARRHENSLHGRCFDELVLTEPELVQEIHREYIRAGAQVIETNTFGANAAKLAAYGLEDRVTAINRRAVQLAREAREIAGQPVFVAGAVGPSGLPNVHAQSDDEHAPRAMRALFRAQIEALVEGGADLLILETFSNLTELRQAVLAAREVARLPIVAQMTFGEDIQSAAGNTPFESAAVLASLGASGPDAILLSAQPNAGLPTRVENRFLYVSTPPYFADYAQRFAGAGVRLIGGCCGTTPAHIAAMREALADALPAFTPALWPVAAISTAEAATSEAPTETAETSRLREELEAGRFVVSVELDPPKGLNPTKILDGAAYLKQLGVRFINVADSPMARVRMSCLAMARLLHDQLDLETIIHFTTRDRNLMALQSDLLGAHALGIHNVLALTGDPHQAGNYPNLTGVWDVDSVGLIELLRAMNAGHDAAGAALGSAAAFHIGAALNLNMEDTRIDVQRERSRRKLAGESADGGAGDDASAALTETELELRRLRAKLEAGAQYIMTQPIYDLEPLERFAATFGPVQVPLILGMIPLHSSKHAEYLHNEVPGISVPDEVRARMRGAGERGREVGIQLAHDVIVAARARGLIAGCYLMPSYGRYDLVGELAQELLRTAAPAGR